MSTRTQQSIKDRERRTRDRLRKRELDNRPPSKAAEAAEAKLPRAKK